MTGKVLKWGNSYGIRVSKADFERARLHVGQEVDLDLGAKPAKLDVSHIRTFDLGGIARHHDALNHLRMLEKLKRTGQLSAADFRKEVASMPKAVRDLVGR